MKLLLLLKLFEAAVALFCWAAMRKDLACCCLVWMKLRTHTRLLWTKGGKPRGLREVLLLGPAEEGGQLVLVGWV
jgi:hypothetical protein